jgi:glycosyltransferase involved in cell wall biosynthesis
VTKASVRSIIAVAFQRARILPREDLCGETPYLVSAIATAFDICDSPRELQAMRRAAMAKNFDWEKSAAQYAALYRRLATAS